MQEERASSVFAITTCDFFEYLQELHSSKSENPAVVQLLEILKDKPQKSKKGFEKKKNIAIPLLEKKNI